MPNPVLRYQMPMVPYRTQYTQLHEPSREENHGRFGYVRVQRGSGDRFRKSITVPVGNPLNTKGSLETIGSFSHAPVTFNRSSLIKYLNAEIDHFNENGVNGQEPLPDRLSIGWFGGWIGGSSDERIRRAYDRVFRCYQPVHSSIQVPRSLREDTLINCPVVWRDVSPQSFERRPLLCLKSYNDNFAKISLFRSPPPHEVADFNHVGPSCDLYIDVTRSIMNTPALMDSFWNTGGLTEFIRNLMDAILTTRDFTGFDPEEALGGLESISIRRIYVSSIRDSWGSFSIGPSEITGEIKEWQESKRRQFRIANAR